MARPPAATLGRGLPRLAGGERTSSGGTGGPAPIPRPGPVLGPYPERTAEDPGWLEAALGQAAGRLGALSRPGSDGRARLVEQIAQAGEALTRLNDTALRAIARDLRYELTRDGTTERLSVKAFALVREMAGRTLGMRHHDVQLYGGWLLLGGKLAEMATGEGKTLTATLASCTAALAGIPVHVITVNDYLAGRDAREMAPLYEALGLSVGVVIGETDAAGRARAYRCDVTYCTGKEVAFDYLRDFLARAGADGSLRLRVARRPSGEAERRQLLLRGLCYAIVDEADSVLIDEARTPLVLARSRAESSDPQIYRDAIALAAGLEEGPDYALDRRDRIARLSESGRDRLLERLRAMPERRIGTRRCVDLVTIALAATLYERDRHYLVREGKIELIDENTGRVLEGRSWQRELHQLVETREGCELTSPNETLAQISYRRFYRRYLRLSGMTGTAREVASEIHAVYGLESVQVPTHRPSRRAAGPTRTFTSTGAKWRAVIGSVRERLAQGRPVLIGTHSVSESEGLSEMLAAEGIPHQVLNARQDQAEATIIRRAGLPGQVTVATNMAGRGTDIKLSAEVAGRGGLHVIVATCNESRRIDRQLVGRCARQGDPGSYEILRALDDQVPAAVLARWVQALLRLLAAGRDTVPARAGRVAMRAAQRGVERHHLRLRRDLIRQDRRLADLLAFSGRPE